LWYSTYDSGDTLIAEFNLAKVRFDAFELSAALAELENARHAITKILKVILLLMIFFQWVE
jgi:hypothetical protein